MSYFKLTKINSPIFFDWQNFFHYSFHEVKRKIYYIKTHFAHSVTSREIGTELFSKKSQKKRWKPLTT